MDPSPSPTSTSGLLITLDPDSAQADSTLRLLAADPRFTLGPRQGHALPAVLEAPDNRQAEEIFRWLGQLPGIRNVDVVFVEISEDTCN